MATRHCGGTKLNDEETEALNYMLQRTVVQDIIKKNSSVNDNFAICDYFHVVTAQCSQGWLSFFFGRICSSVRMPLCAPQRLSIYLTA